MEVLSASHLAVQPVVNPFLNQRQWSYWVQAWQEWPGLFGNDETLSNPSDSQFFCSILRKPEQVHRLGLSSIKDFSEYLVALVL